jgi:N utilization substance protein B
MLVPRRYARELALKVLFEYDLAKTPLEPLLERSMRRASTDDRQFAETLVRGVVAHQTDIDQWIEQAARAWRVPRMPTVDRNIMRIGAYEVGFEPEMPLSVIINEAVELAKTFSTEDARRFINGVLGSIGQRLRPEGDSDRPRYVT